MKAIVDLLTSDDEIICPHCGHKESVSDPEVGPYVISYWGDGEPHKFSCCSCLQDFVVKEEVIRKFETAKTADEFN